MAEHAALLFVALLLDWVIGDPPWLWRHVPHPVAIFGKAIEFGDKALNNSNNTPATAMRLGAVLTCGLILAALLVGFILDGLAGYHREAGWVLEILVIQIFLAQKSLLDHVGNVASTLLKGGIEQGRIAVAKIVGRDPQSLGESGICRAAIESLAENFSDGVVAPAFWYLVFGLPGLLVYKMINTADSMIGYKSDKYIHFGSIAAQIDDLANWLPSRLSMGLIALAALINNGFTSAKNAVLVALRDAQLHASPNAGWPEAAMAGACDLALGGPRIYRKTQVQQAYINAPGKMDLSARDIIAALHLTQFACFLIWVLAAILYLML